MNGTSPLAAPQQRDGTSRLSDALGQIDFARRYNLERIDTVPPAVWFTVPPDGVSHVARQVGHLASSEYRLCLERLRPRTAADESLIPDACLAAFSRESLPAGATGFAAGQIRAVFDRGHARVVEELPSYPGADLDLPPLKPHAVRDARRRAALRRAARDDLPRAGRDDQPDARHEADLVNPRRPVRIL